MTPNWKVDEQRTRRLRGGDPNLYVYARSDPVNLADPNGLLPVPPLGGGITGAGPAGLTVIEGGAGAPPVAARRALSSSPQLSSLPLLWELGWA
jgi:hypothetical protein